MSSSDIHWVTEPTVGLHAVIVLDNETLGPAAGGVRTRRYDTEQQALRECQGLARAMTYKCAISGLAAGGGKAVVIEQPDMDRPRAFELLGEYVQNLGGRFRTAGDFGTGPAELAAMAKQTEFVHVNERDLAASVARGLLRCVEACAAVRGAEFAGLRIAVQGCGAIGAAVARSLAAAGARVLVSDLAEDRARSVADELCSTVVSPDDILTAAVDIIAPCAVGGVVTEAVAESVSAWAVCGAANNILASAAAGELLQARGILFVPDLIASAGAVIDGIGETVMGLVDRTGLIDQLGATAREVLQQAAASGRTSTSVAEQRARARIAAGAGTVGQSQ